MIRDTLSRIEAAINRIKAGDGKKKAELAKLLSKLKKEIEGLTESYGEHARSIAGFAEAAAHEATRKEKSQRLLELSLEGLSSSVKGFELSHPKLVEAANDVCLLLSSLGI